MGDCESDRLKFSNSSSHTKPVYKIKAKLAFLEGRLFSSKSGLFENFSDCSDWLDKSRPSKKATFV